MLYIKISDRVLADPIPCISERVVDCYVKVGKSPLNGIGHKAFKQPPRVWSWGIIVEGNKGEPYNFSEPGIYEIKVTGRTKNFNLDRIVFYDPAKVSEEEATGLY